MKQNSTEFTNFKRSLAKLDHKMKVEAEERRKRKKANRLNSKQTTKGKADENKQVRN